MVCKLIFKPQTSLIPRPRWLGYEARIQTILFKRSRERIIVFCRLVPEIGLQANSAQEEREMDIGYEFSVSLHDDRAICLFDLCPVASTMVSVAYSWSSLTSVRVNHTDEIWSACQHDTIH